MSAVDLPEIVLAPMAGGPATVELAAAVCEAGGLGFLAAGYLAADVVAGQIEQLRARTDRPFGVNVFVAAPAQVDEAALARYLEELRPEADRLGVELGVPRADDDDLAAKLELLERAAVPVVSCTFGCPAPEVVRMLQRAGSHVWVTVTSLEEARIAARAGCDAVVAQGAAAGGHRASFVDDGGVGALDTDELVRMLAAELDVPVVAAGGVMDGADVARLRVLGARAVQAGTAFLLADEAGTHAVHRAALATSRPTGWTRAFSGRTARGIVNEFMRAHAHAPSAYPHVHHATSPLRAAARAAGDGERVNLWAGEGHARAQAAPAAEIVRRLAQQL